MKKISLTFTLAACLAFQACETLDFAGFAGITDTAVNKRFDASMEILKSSPVADVDVSSDEYQFYMVTDIHCDGSTDRLERLVCSCIADKGTEKVLLCLGDIVNGRDYQKEISLKLKPLEDNGWRFFNALGNHDTYFFRYGEFHKYWPLTTYSFKVNLPCGKSDLFICLDSADGSIGTSQRAWIEEQLTLPGNWRNKYVFTHTNFFNTDNTQFTSGNYSLEETHDLLGLFASCGVKCVLTGHDHFYEYRSFRGVAYYTFNALLEPYGSYYLMTFGDEMKFAELTVE